MGIFSSRQGRLDKALLKAVTKGRLADMEQLLSQGANPNIAHEVDMLKYKTVIHTLLEKHVHRPDFQAKALMLLKANGADMNFIDQRFAMMPLPVIHAISCGVEYPVIELMIHLGADVRRDAPNVPVYEAIIEKRADVIQLLKDHGASFNFFRARDKNTPLHMAVETGQLQIVQMLIDYNLDPFVKNKDGDTPRMLARQKGYWDIVGALEKAEEKVREEVLKLPETIVEWEKTGESEIARIDNTVKAGRVITQIFNFSSRVLTQIATNIKTKAESQAMLPFDHFADVDLIETARRELINQGGKVAMDAALSSPLQIRKG